MPLMEDSEILEPENIDEINEDEIEQDFREKNLEIIDEKLTLDDFLPDEYKENQPVSKKGKLFIVSTPIGNKSDYTLRAIDALRVSDYVVCEEFKEGSRIMRELNLRKELISLNEQNEATEYMDIISLIKKGNKVSLVSDCGTPVFADPGAILVNSAIENGLKIEVIPGPTSIMTALVRSTFDIQKFYYYGFLNRKPEIRRDEINNLAKHPSTVVLLETPYRLMPVLKSFTDVMPNRRAYIGFNLTMKHESHHYGTFQELLDKFDEERIKAEFVIVFEGNQAVDFDNVKFADKPYWRRDMKERLGDRWNDNKRDKKFNDRHRDRRIGDDNDRRRDDRRDDRRRDDRRRDDRSGDRRRDDRRRDDRSGDRRRDDRRRDDRRRDDRRRDDRRRDDRRRDDRNSSRRRFNDDSDRYFKKNDRH